MDVVQDVIVSEHDCGTVDGIELTHIKEGGDIKTPLAERIIGRVLLYPVHDPDEPEKILLPENTLITESEAKLINDKGISSVMVRSPLTCQSERGICALCYGATWPAAIWSIPAKPWASSLPSPSASRAPS